MKKVFIFELEGQTCAKCPLCFRDCSYYYCKACQDDKGYHRFIDTAEYPYELREVPDWCPCTTIVEKITPTGTDIIPIARYFKGTEEGCKEISSEEYWERKRKSS